MTELNELEVRSIEIIQGKEQREKRLKKKNEEALNKLWDCIKQSNIQVTNWEPEREEIGAKNFKVHPKISQVLWKKLYRCKMINTKQNEDKYVYVLRHIIVKLLKVKIKSKSWKKRKMTLHTGNNISLTAAFL